MQRLRPWTASGRRVPYRSRLPRGNHRQITFLCLGTFVPGILGVTAVVESGKAVKATFWARLIRKARHGAQASGTEGSTPTPSRALAQNGCLRWNAKTFTPADKRASLETEAYFPRGTEISNPVPSSKQSVSRGISPSCIEKSAVAAVCAGPTR